MKNSADQGGCYPPRPKICKILHILGKPNSIIALLFIQNISPFLIKFGRFALCFSAHQNHNLVPGFFRSTVE